MYSAYFNVLLQMNRVSDVKNWIYHARKSVDRAPIDSYDG